MAVARADTTPFTDFGSALEWANRLSQTDVAVDKIRLLTIRGNKPATTKTNIVLTNNRTVITNRRHILNFVVDEVNDDNYDFFRMTQCGIIQFRIWPITDDGKELQGGDAGILATVFAEAIYDEGTGAIQRIVGTAEWDAQQDPQRVANPIAGFVAVSS